jgi:hypothetical protein
MPARPIDHERKACDAVARVLEERAGATRSNPRCPEMDGSGPVEYVFDLAGVTYAFEHTLIEAFERQIHIGVDFGKFWSPKPCKSCSAAEPTGRTRSGWLTPSSRTSGPYGACWDDELFPDDDSPVRYREFNPAVLDEV